MTNNWEWPKQSDRLTLDTVKDMKCDHSPFSLHSTVKLSGETETYYCLKCWKHLGDPNDYNMFDSMGPEDF